MEYPYALNVVQQAFAILGQSSRPTVVDDEQDNPTFRDCSMLYEGIRKAILACHPWNFARAIQPVSSAEVAPNKYLTPIPGDCIRILKLTDEMGDELERTRSGNFLYSEAPASSLIYIRDEEDPACWDEWARKALIHRLAADFSRIVKGSLQERQLQEDAYNLALAEAKRLNSQEEYTNTKPSYADNVFEGRI